MHQFPRFPHSVRSSKSDESAFSLVEITLSIGIIAFAFVALFGLLPSGLTVFRQSIDAANEMWIMQDLNTMIQVTDWSKDPSTGKSKVESLAFDKGGLIYFYDEEGRLTDTARSDEPSSDAAIELRRLYAVKLVIDQVERPGGGTGGDKYMPNTYRISTIFAPYTDPSALAEFRGINKPQDLKILDRGSAIKTRSFVISRMGSENE
jgi:uncharacterized protein (TIGR02598 family)